MTQQQLGERLEPPYTLMAVSHIECGRRRLLAHVAAQIATVLDVPIQSLLEPPP